MTSGRRRRRDDGRAPSQAVVALVVAGALAAAGVLAGSSPVGAEEVSADELRRLVAAASSDATALDRLRAVDRVDGIDVDLRAALEGPPGPDLDARLARLSDSLGPPGTTARTAGDGDPSAVAARILAAERYQPARPERRGLFRRIGELAQPVLRPITRFVRAALRPVGALLSKAFASAGSTAITGFVVIVVVVAIAVAAVRRRAALAVAARTGALFDERDDPVDLERRADAAAETGDLRTAVRLRFRSGLVRLHRAGAPIRPSTTTGQVATIIDDRRYEELGRTFDAVAYGGRDATAADLEAARAQWPAVVAAARGRVAA